MNIKEESLKKALIATRLLELPKQFREDSNEYWLEAVILTKKRDGSHSYAIGRRDASGKICYMADYGSMSQIIGLVSVHPYFYLNKRKYMQYDTIIQKRTALVQFIGGDSEATNAVNSMSDEDVENTLLGIAIELQYSEKKIMTTHDNIIAAVKGSPIHAQEETNGDKSNNINNLNDANLDEIMEDKPKRMLAKRQSTVTRTKRK